MRGRRGPSLSPERTPSADKHISGVENDAGSADEGVLISGYVPINLRQLGPKIAYYQMSSSVEGYPRLCSRL